jgi:hypothetical protein
LVEVCPWNLVEYSEQFNNANWVAVGSTISSNVLVAPNGTTTADKLVEDTSNGVHITLQINGNRNVSSIYSFSVYAKAGERTKINLFNNGNGAGNANFDLVNGTATLIAGEFATIENVGNGWYRCNVGMQENSTVGSFNYHIRLLDASGNDSYTGNGTSGAYIWGAQINLGTAKPYFPTTDRLNVPRLTYQNGGGGCPSLLLEKQSTNNVLSSQNLTTIWNLSNTTATANSTTSPDGTQNASKLEDNSVNTQHRYFQNILNGLTNETISFSIYAKQGTHRYISWGITDDTGYRGQVVVDLQTGTITDQFTTSATLSNLSVASQGNGWYRISGTIAVSSNYAGGNAYAFGLMLNSSSWSTGGYVGTGTYCYLWGGQAELSSYPTSYIPTTSASATRVADACFKTGISSLIGQTSGTVFWDIQVETLSASGLENILNIDAGSFGNTIYFIVSGNSNIIIGEMYASSVLQASFTLSSITAGRYKIALGYANNNTALFINGTQVGTTDTSCSVPAMSRLQLGSGVLGPSDGKVNQAILFPTRLTNAELASLTTL